MKKFRLFIVIAFFLPIGIGKAQITDFTKQVLKTCVSMPEFQESYRIAKNNKTKQVYVLQHGVFFNEKDIEKIEGFEIILVDKEQIIKNHITDYFLFWTFDLIENGAFVEFTYENIQISKKTSLYITLRNQELLIFNKKIEEVHNEN